MFRTGEFSQIARVSKRLLQYYDEIWLLKPAVETMASAVQTGGPDLVSMALGRIGHWIEANGYRMAGPYREIAVELPISGALDDMVVEVQMPIAKLRASSGQYF